MQNDKTRLSLVVIIVTAAINLLFIITGTTSTVSCTLSAGVQKALAAITE